MTTFLDSKLFSLSKVDSTYVAEISELGLRMCQSRFGSPPYMLTLLNCPTPGVSRSFVLDNVDKNDGDIMGWNYVELDKSTGRASRRPDFRVLIIND